MWLTRPFEQKWRSAFKPSAWAAALSLIAPVCVAQTQKAEPRYKATTEQALFSDPEFLSAVGRMVQKLQQGVQLPPARSESRLLPLLPPNTISVAAIPNYGDAAHQALEIFRKELQENVTLREKWQSGDLAAAGPKIEDSFEKFYQLSQFLGDEILVSGVMDAKEPTLLVFAEVRKPGLKKILADMIEQCGGTAKAGVRVIEPLELGTAKQKEHASDLIVLVRPDFVVASEDMTALRNFNAKLNQGNREFLSTAFGKRVATEYQGGVTLLAAANLEEILSKSPTAKQDSSFQQSGFAEMQYLLWEHKKLGAKTVSQAELSFTGPRHGSAAWLAKPGPLPSLDFISPDAITAGAFQLTNLAQVFEEVKDLMGSGSASPIASLPQMEKALGLTLKDDLLGPLGGELAFELDSVTPQPAWKAMLSVKDADHLQKTLSTVMAAAQIKPEQTEDGGVIYHNVFIPSSPRPYEIDYAFLDGYLIVSSTHTALVDAVRLHRSGGSLAKSSKLQASRPPGHSLEASALLYENPVALAALQLRRFAPGLEDSLLSATKDATPAVICFYGEESAISEASSSGALDVGGALVVAAIAIPNLLKSKVAANEASAVGSLRTISTAQIIYQETYPKRGFAPNLATLGPDPKGGSAESPEHAGLVDASLAGPTCTGDAWCIKSGYQFRITAYCKEHLCGNYLAVATPVSDNSGTRNFCTTSDGLIRLQSGAPLASSLTVAECRKWPPLQ